MAIEQTGTAEMRAKMLGMAEHLCGPGAKTVVRAGGNVIREAMVEHAPVLVEKNAGSNALEPGAIKRDIKVRFPARENQLQETAIIGPGPATSHQSRFVEYGHRMVVGGYSKVEADGRVRGPGVVQEKDVRGYPFLRPAYEASISSAKAAMVEAASDELKKAVK